MKDLEKAMKCVESNQKGLEYELNMELEEARDALNSMIRDLSRAKADLEELMKKGAVNGAIPESSTAEAQSSVFGTYTRAITRAKSLQRFYWMLEGFKEE